jgi:hypothetical protein
VKIDKVLFSCSASADYSPFWNLQARIYKEHFNIEPVCLLYGRKADTAMEEKHGRIIEVEADPSLPWALQLVWSKFDFPLCEPETTWLIGDIDLLPLQTAHFVDKLAGLPDDAYVHLNSGGISQPRLGCMDGFVRIGSMRHIKDTGVNGGADLPGHYHVAKGKAFSLLTQGRQFLDQIRHIVESDRYGMGVMGNWAKEKRQSDSYWYYWCAEENYSSELIWNAIKAGQINFIPIYYNNTNGTDRINRDAFTSDYAYSADKASNRHYVDIHCARPYARQHDQLARILKLAWNI